MPRRISIRAVFQGFAYRLRHHPSFYVSVVAHLICATATIGFILAFIQQASFTGNTRRLNIVIISALLGAVLFTSCFLILARIIAVRTSFNTIPKPYIPTKHIDVPRKVAEHITTEYTRTAVIAYISQPTAEKQEGWGRPGTQFASIHFRKSIRETFHAILKTLDDVPPTPGSSTKQRITYPPYAIIQITSHPNWPPTAQPLLNLYEDILQKAKYARSEPDAAEYERCVKIVALIMGLIKTTHPQSEYLPETPARAAFPDPETPRTTATRPGGVPRDEDTHETLPTHPLADSSSSSTDQQTQLASPQPIYPTSRSRHNSVVRSSGRRETLPRTLRHETYRHPGLLSLFDHESHQTTHDAAAPLAVADLHRDRVETVAPPAESAGNGNPTSSSHAVAQQHTAPTHRRRSHHARLGLARNHQLADPGNRRQPSPRRQHHHQFSPWHSLPRPRRGETTRYIDGGEGTDSDAEGGGGGGGFFHTVWGTGRDADRDRSE
ncbi:hypothetical protein QFC21_003924 [Naganishia friedmannii]|uniref:Uncharacterized protein n=1 Tax=Naganishia friedmannii TaxID=89922 RepID=A0ACC2VL96_9TREE|nr:hypothetical protein QFC21_003924 [Naganishia friedmannii]